MAILSPGVAQALACVHGSCHCESAGGRRGNLGFFFIAIASATEVQSHIYVALDQSYVSQDAFDEIYEQTGKTSRMISGLIKYLRRGLTK